MASLIPLIDRLFSRIGFKSTIARNSMMLIMAQIMGSGINAILSIFVANHFFSEQMGILRYVTSYCVLLSVLTELGLTRAAVIAVARNQRGGLQAIMGHLVMLRWATTGLYVFILCISLLLLFNRGEMDQYRAGLILLMAASIVLQSFRRNAEAVFQATERMSYNAGFFLANRMLSALLICAVLVLDLPLVAVIAAAVIADGFDAVGSWILVRRRVLKPVYVRDAKAKLDLLKIGWPFTLQMLAGQIYYFVSTVLLKHLAKGSPAEVDNQIGLYGIAYSIVVVLVLIPINLSQALFPQMTRAFHEKDSKRLYSLFSYGFNLMALAGAPTALLFYTFRAELIPLIYDPDFAGSIPMLGVVIWTLVFAFLNAPISNLLASSNRQYQVSAAAFICAGFNIALNWKLIPRLGGMGASMATVATEAVNLLVLCVCLALWHCRAIEWKRFLPIASVQITVIAGFFWIDGSPLALRIFLYLFYILICGVWIKDLMRRRRLGGI